MEGAPAACQTRAFDRDRLKVCLNKAAAREAGEAGSASVPNLAWTPKLPLLLARIGHRVLFRWPGVSPDLETVV